MRRSIHRQMLLALAADDLEARVPATSRSRCRDLLIRLLREVVEAETRERRGDDEREDSPAAS